MAGRRPGGKPKTIGWEQVDSPDGAKIWRPILQARPAELAEPAGPGEPSLQACPLPSTSATAPGVSEIAAKRAQVASAQVAAFDRLIARAQGDDLGDNALADTIRQLRLIDQDLAAQAAQAAEVAVPDILPTRTDLDLLTKLARGQSWDQVTGGPMPPEVLRAIRQARERCRPA